MGQRIVNAALNTDKEIAYIMTSTKIKHGKISHHIKRVPVVCPRTSCPKTFFPVYLAPATVTETLTQTLTLGQSALGHDVPGQEV